MYVLMYVTWNCKKPAPTAPAGIICFIQPPSGFGLPLFDHIACWLIECQG